MHIEPFSLVGVNFSIFGGKLSTRTAVFGILSQEFSEFPKMKFLAIFVLGIFADDIQLCKEGCQAEYLACVDSCAGDTV